MAVSRILASRGLRQHIVGWALVVLLLAVGLGGALTSIEVAHRTEVAYGEYRARSAVGNLVVNPGFDTASIEEAIRTTPGVQRVASDSLLTAAVIPVGADDARRAELESNYFLQVRTSDDGRYVIQDKPVVLRGRMVSPTAAEVFLDVGVAARLGVDVGDVVGVDFYSPGYDTSSTEDQEVVAALGTETAPVVGVGVLADEVLSDEIFPRERVIVSAALARPYDCRFPEPDPNDTRSLDELFVALIDPRCSTSYRYYSMIVDGGDAGAVAVAEALKQRAEAANARLPVAFREADIGYTVIASFTADDADQLREALSPVVTALRVFGMAVAIGTVAVALLLMVRLIRRCDADVGVWRTLGVDRAQRVAALAAPAVVAVVVGSLAGAAVAWVASAIGAISGAEAVDPSPGRALSAPVLLVALGAAAAIVLGVLAAARVAASPGDGWVVRGRTSWLTEAMRGRPALSLGVRAATTGRGAGALLAGSVLAVASVAAALVFGASLARLVDTPLRFGWPYEVGLVVNAGYGDANLDAMRATLDRPEVERWGLASLAGGLTVNGATVPSLAAREGFDELLDPSTLVAGRLPSGSDEIALGALTAAKLGLGVGDEADVGSLYGEHRGRVSGLVMLPAVGPLESDRTSIGTGVLLPAPFFDALVRARADVAGQPAAAIADALAGFVVLDLAPGVDRAAFLASIGSELRDWDPFHVPPVELTRPVRPPVVVDVADMQGVPIALACVLATTMAISMVAGITAGTNARRRELAVLRAVGGRPRQLRASVRWHGAAVVAVSLVLGVPSGIALGRAAFGAFADDLGAVRDPAVPALVLVGLAAAVVAIGLLASVVPARRALRAVRRTDVFERAGSAGS